MIANIIYVSLFFQESHAIGKRPDNPTDQVEEGELLLTLNIFYPVIFQKVGCILIPPQVKSCIPKQLKSVNSLRECGKPLNCVNFLRLFLAFILSVVYRR